MAKKLMMNNYSENGLIPVMDGLVCWLDGRDGKTGDTVWKDRSGNGNDVILMLNGGCFKKSIFCVSREDTSQNIVNMFDYNTDLTIEINTGIMPLNFGSNTVCKVNSFSNDFIMDFRYGNVKGTSSTTNTLSIPLRNPDALIWLSSNFNTKSQTMTLTKKNNYFELFSNAVSSYNIYRNIIMPKDNIFNLISTFEGEIYSIRIYNRALTEEEIQQNYLYEQSIERS